MSRKITVVTTLYNSEEFISECIESVLAQDYNAVEHIVVDDMSTDSGREIVSAYQKKYPDKVRLISLDENVGTYAAANVGINASGTELIARLDSDDVATVDRISTQAGFLEANEDYSLVGAQALKIDSRGAILDTLTVPQSYSDIVGHMAMNNAFIHSSVMFRKADFHRQGGYPEARKSQDYKLFLGFVSEGLKVCNLPKYLVFYRSQPKSITATSFEDQQRLMLAAQYEYLTNFLGLDLTESRLIELRKAIFSPQDLGPKSKQEKFRLIRDLKSVEVALVKHYPDIDDVELPIRRIRNTMLGNIMRRRRTYLIGKLYYQLPLLTLS